MAFFSMVFSLFLVMNPLGNIPLFLSQLGGIPPRRQRSIVVRELLIALALMCAANFIGEALLDLIHVSRATMQIAGGVLLFLIALRMIFPEPKGNGDAIKREEPFIVPLAVPAVAGPAVFATIMIYAAQEPSEIRMLSAIVIAWMASAAILLSVAFIGRYMSKRVMTAWEQLMGLVLTLMATKMFLQGIRTLILSEI